MARSLRESERQLWEIVTQEIRPLKGRAPAPSVAPVLPPPTPDPPPAPVPAPATNTHKPRPQTVAMAQMVEVGRRQPGLDDTSWRQLSNGRLRAERTLDLHGRTAQAAFTALHGFLLRAQAERLRCVEIITGVGSGQEGGILRRELPFWLSRQDLRHLVLAAVHPHPGNPGSVRVLLRRRVNKSR
nr:Smr/MutS family protein [uncultured Lichenicoccus sp.]